MTSSESQTVSKKGEEEEEEEDNEIQKSNIKLPLTVCNVCLKIKTMSRKMVDFHHFPC